MVFLILQDCVRGHVTLGTAHYAGPPHLILISLCSSLFLCAVWWFRVWFCQTCHVALGFQIATEGRANLKKTLGFQKPNGSSLNTDTPSKLGLWLSVDNTFSVLVSRLPYWLFVLANQARFRYSPQRRGVSSSWMPKHWLGECWVCKSTTCLLSTFFVHSESVCVVIFLCA